MVELKDNEINQFQKPGQKWGADIPTSKVKGKGRMVDADNKEELIHKMGVTMLPDGGVNTTRL